MLGSALVLAAVCLYVYDRLEDARAGAQAASAVSQLRQSQSIAAVSEAERPADSAESLPTEDAESESESASETPASSIRLLQREMIYLQNVLEFQWRDLPITSHMKRL